MDANARAAQAARASYGRLVAILAARSGDIAAAEESLSDAFLAALENWPKSGIPDNPEAWLMAAAKNRTIDRYRRNARSPITAVRNCLMWRTTCNKTKPSTAPFQTNAWR